MCHSVIDISVAQGMEYRKRYFDTQKSNPTPQHAATPVALTKGSTEWVRVGTSVRINDSSSVINSLISLLSSTLPLSLSPLATAMAHARKHSSLLLILRLRYPASPLLRGLRLSARRECENILPGLMVSQ